MRPVGWTTRALEARAPAATGNGCGSPAVPRSGASADVPSGPGGYGPVVPLIALVLGALLAALAAAVAALAAGLRRGSPAARRTVRRFNRAVVNPRMLRTAGTPGAYAAVVVHVGRRSGRLHRTPVVAEPAGDGFVIALPYGTSSDWVRNVLASGSAEITREGATYAVEGPELLPLAEMASCFPEKDRRSLERFRVQQCLRVRRARDVPAADLPG